MTSKSIGIMAVLVGLLWGAARAHAEERDGLVVRTRGEVQVKLYQVHGHYGSVAFEVDPEDPDRAREEAARWCVYLYEPGGVLDSDPLELYTRQVECAERSKAARKAARTKQARDAAESLALEFLDPATCKAAAKERKARQRSGESGPAIGKKAVRPVNLELFTKLSSWQGITGSDAVRQSGSVELIEIIHVETGGQSAASKILLFDSDLVNQVRTAETVIDYAMQMYGRTGSMVLASVEQNARYHWLCTAMRAYFGTRRVDPELGLHAWSARGWTGKPRLALILEMRAAATGIVPMMLKMLREEQPDIFWRLVSTVMGFGGEPESPTISVDTLRKMVGAESDEDWNLWEGKLQRWIQTEVQTNQAAYAEIGERWKKECARVP